jgi:hypothetical protein
MHVNKVDMAEQSWTHTISMKHLTNYNHAPRCVHLHFDLVTPYLCLDPSYLITSVMNFTDLVTHHYKK